MNKRELLIAARNRIDTIGWVQGGAADYSISTNGYVGHPVMDEDRVPMCAWATIIHEADKVNENPAVMRAAIVSVAKSWPRRWIFWRVRGHLPTLNDLPFTTKKTVLKAFDKAIKKSR